MASQDDLLFVGRTKQKGEALTLERGTAGYFLIQIHSAKHLPRADRFGKIDSYFVVEIEHSFCRTQVVKMNRSPKFTSAKFYIASHSNADLRFECWDWDRVTQDDFIGSFVLRQKQHSILASPLVEEPLPLQCVQPYASQIKKGAEPIVVVSVSFVFAAVSNLNQIISAFAPAQFAGGTGSRKSPGPFSPKKTKKTHLIDLFEGSRRGDLALVKDAIENNHIDPAYQNKTFEGGYTAFLLAVSCGSKEICIYLLSKEPRLIDRGDLIHGNKPLLIAAGYGQPAMVLWLISRGVELLEGNSEGNNALHIAALNGQTACVKILITRMTDKRIQSPQSTVNRLGSTPLLLAARNGHLDTIQYLVDEAGCDLEEKASNGNTALLQASFYGHQDIVKWLITMKSVDVKVQNNSGNTALHMAWRNRQWETARLLLSLGADPYQENRATKPDPITPLDELLFTPDRVIAFFKDIVAIQDELQVLVTQKEYAEAQYNRTVTALKYYQDQTSVLAPPASPSLSSSSFTPPSTAKPSSSSSSTSSSTSSTTTTTSSKRSKHSSSKKSSSHKTRSTNPTPAISFEGFGSSLSESLTHESHLSKLHAHTIREELPQLKAYLSLLNIRTDQFRRSPKFSPIIMSVSNAISSFLSELATITDFEQFLISMEALILIIFNSPSLANPQLLHRAALRLVDPKQPGHWARRFNVLMILCYPRLGLSECWQMTCDLANALFTTSPTPQQLSLRIPNLNPADFLTPIAFEVMYARSQLVSDVSSPDYFRPLLKKEQVVLDFSKPQPYDGSTSVFPACIPATNLECGAVGPLAVFHPSAYTTCAFLYHRSIQPLYGCFLSNDSVYALMAVPNCKMLEMVPDTFNNAVTPGTLRLKDFSLRQRLIFAVQILQGLQYVNNLGLHCTSLSLADLVFFSHPCLSHPSLRGAAHDGPSFMLAPFILRTPISDLPSVVPTSLHMLLSPERLSGLYSPSPFDAFSQATDMYSFGFIFWALLHCIDPLTALVERNRNMYITQTRTTQRHAQLDLKDSTFRHWFISRAGSPLPLWLPANAPKEVDLLKEFKSTAASLQKGDQQAIFNVLTRCWTDVRSRITPSEALNILQNIVFVPSLQHLCVQTLLNNHIESISIPPHLLKLFK